MKKQHKIINGESYPIDKDKYFQPKDSAVITGDSQVGKDISPEKLMAVHLTNTIPEDGVIHPTSSYDPNTWRNTIHFSINCPVKAHGGYEGWENKSSAILIPFEKIKDRIEYFTPVDSFVVGDLEIPEESHIIYSDNNSIHEETSKKIKELGYVSVEGGAWNWNYGGEWQPNNFESLLEENNLKYGYHTDTAYSQLEKLSSSKLVQHLDFEKYGLKEENLERLLIDNFKDFTKGKSTEELISIYEKEIPNELGRMKEDAYNFLRINGKNISPEYKELVEKTYN